MAAKRSALIVATSQYKDGRLPPLAGPAEDARALRTVLARPDIGGFEVRVALNFRAATLRTTLEAFFSDRARDDLLLVHFSGHGLKDDDGQLYLTATDTKIDRLLSTGIDAAWVNRLMGKCRSETIALFLDCCFAGAFTSGMTRRAAGESVGVREAFRGSGLVVIAASDSMQYSFEGGRQVGDPPAPSPFTKAFVDGLATGEADINEDGKVSINELFEFLEDRIHQTSPSQTPTRSAFNQTGDWVIANSTKTPSTKLLPDSVQAALASERPIDRVGVLFDLTQLIEGADQRVAQAAMQAMSLLAHDDSQIVSARARALLDEGATRPDPSRKGRSPITRRAASGATPTGVAGSDESKGTEPAGSPDESADGRPGATSRRPRTAVPAIAGVGVLGLLTIALALTLGNLGSGNVSPSTSLGQSAIGQPTVAATARTSATAQPITPLPIPGDRLSNDELIQAGSAAAGASGGELIDGTGTYALRFTGVGDVVVENVHTHELRWRANVNGAVQVYLQSDGNLVIHGPLNSYRWDTGALPGDHQYRLTLEEDGNLALELVGTSAPLWRSQTDGGCLGSWCLKCVKYRCEQRSS